MLDETIPASNSEIPSDDPGTSTIEQAYQIALGFPGRFEALDAEVRMDAAQFAWGLAANCGFNLPDSDCRAVLRAAWRDPRCRLWMQNQQSRYEYWNADTRRTWAALMEGGVPEGNRGDTADAIQAAPPRWLWYPLIPRDAVSLIVGRPETGKTALAIRLAAYLTRGQALPNFSRHPMPTVKTAPVRVLWYDAESTPGAFRRRLEAVGADLSRVHFIGNEYDTTLDAIDTIRADIEAMPETPALVVFDTLAGFLPDRCDIERMAPARRLLRPLAALAAEKGISIVLLHHEGKGARSDLIHVGVGSIGIMGAARSALFCAKHPEQDGVHVMLHAKCSEEAKAQGVAYRLNRHEFQDASSVRLDFDGVTDVDEHAVMEGPGRKPDDAEKGAQDEAAEFLLHYLSDGPALKRDVLAAARAEEISERTLKRAREALDIESSPQPQDNVPRNRWPYQWALRVVQNTHNDDLAHPGLPNDTRINTGDARVGQGGPKTDSVRVEHPKISQQDTQPPADPEVCFHGNKKLVSSGIRERWECPDCGKFRGGGHSRWRAPDRKVTLSIEDRLAAAIENSEDAAIG